MYYVRVHNHNLNIGITHGIFVREDGKGGIKLIEERAGLEKAKTWITEKGAMNLAKKICLKYNYVKNDTLYIGCTTDVLNSDNRNYINSILPLCQVATRKSDVTSEHWESLLDYYINGTVTDLYKVISIYKGYGFAQARVTCIGRDGRTKVFIINPRLESTLRVGDYINPDRYKYKE